VDGKTKRLEYGWNIRLGEHEGLSRNPDDALIRAAAGGGWQLAEGSVGDVAPDNGEVARVELPDVGTTAQAGRLRAVCMRIRAEAFQKCSFHIAPISEQINILFIILSSSRFGAMPSQQNIVGPQIRSLRFQRDWTQEELAARCTVRGLELSRATLSKIEAQLRCVTDDELVTLAAALGVTMNQLFPVREGARKRR
jgi:DNA-binding XRE family transcriptional regulator